MPDPNAHTSSPETHRPTLAQLGPMPKHPLNPLDDPDPRVRAAERMRLYHVVIDTAPKT